MAIKVGKFSINEIDGKHVIIHKDVVIYNADSFDEAMKITKAFNKVYKSGYEDGSSLYRASRLVKTTLY